MRTVAYVAAKCVGTNARVYARVITARTFVNICGMKYCQIHDICSLFLRHIPLKFHAVVRRAYRVLLGGSHVLYI